jgi:spore coat-associated protein N
MKKILGLTVAALLVMGLVGGGTWAYFSDTETSQNNSLTAGTLDLTIGGGNTAVTTFSATAVKPGDSGTGSSVLANTGSMNGTLGITFSAISNTSGGTAEFNNGTGDLGANTEMAVYIDVDQSGAFNAGDIGLKADGTTYTSVGGLQYASIDSYGGKSYAAVETLANGAADSFAVAWNVPTTAGNSIQGDAVSFDVTFTLDQIH